MIYKHIKKYVTYRQHIRQPKLQQIDAKGHIRMCGGGNLKIMSFFAIQQDNKILTLFQAGGFLAYHLLQLGITFFDDSYEAEIFNSFPTFN